MSSEATPRSQTEGNLTSVSIPNSDSQPALPLTQSATGIHRNNTVNEAVLQEDMKKLRQKVLHTDQLFVAAQKRKENRTRANNITAKDFIPFARPDAHDSANIFELVERGTILEEETDQILLRIAALMASPHGVPVNDKLIGFTRYTECFSGYKAISWLVKTSIAKNRPEALTIGKQLLGHGFISALTSVEFVDGYELYSFTEKVDIDDTVVSLDLKSLEYQLPEKEKSILARLDNIRVRIFATVMSTSSLGLVWRRYNDRWDIDAFVDIAWFFQSLALFFFTCCTIIYACKIIFRFKAFHAEWNDPIGRNLFSTISMSILLLSTAAFDVDDTFAEVLLWIGLVVQSFLAFEIVGHWLTARRNIEDLNPTFFLPVVGLSLVTAPAFRLGYSNVATIYFGAALFYYTSLFFLVFLRLVFYPPLPPKLVVTIFILFAPPALIFNGYVVIVSGNLDTISNILFGVVLFTVVITIRLRLSLESIPFSLSWWAYSFPINAVALAFTSFHIELDSAVSWVFFAIGAFTANAFWFTIFFASCYYLFNWKVYLPHKGASPANFD